MTIGDRIRELRTLHGWSQQKLSDHTGVHKSLVARYELNIANPTVEGLIKFARTFNVTADYLLFGKADESTFNDKELFELIKNADKYSMENRILIKKIIYAISLKEKEESF